MSYEKHCRRPATPKCGLVRQPLFADKARSLHVHSTEEMVYLPSVYFEPTLDN